MLRVELPEEEALELGIPEPESPPLKGKGRGKGKGFKGKKGKKSKPKKKNRGLKKTWRNIDFYANKRRDATWRRSVSCNLPTMGFTGTTTPRSLAK